MGRAKIGFLEVPFTVFGLRFERKNVKTRIVMRVFEVGG